MKPFFIIFILLSILSCSNKKQEIKSANLDVDALQDTVAHLSVTILTQLPDLLQPKTVYSDTMPAPQVISALGNRGSNIVRPISKSEKNESIVDSKKNSVNIENGGRYNFTNFTTENGLALDAINCSIVDKSGNLWFGTAGGGVSRYDGKSFTNFSTAHGLASNIVKSIFKDKTGNLWLGTDAGVSRYDGKSFNNFTSGQDLKNNTIMCIIEDKLGNLWFGTDGGGVLRYDGSAIVNLNTSHGLASNNVTSGLLDHAGNLWFGTDAGVSRYDGRTFTTITSTQGLANNAVMSIKQDKSGNLWFGTYGGGVSRYDGKSFSNFTTTQGLANSTVISILEDKLGNLWFGTMGGGVSRFDGKSFSSINTTHGLSNNVVKSVTEDKTGNLWFGTKGGGVSRYEGKSFINYSTSQGLINNAVLSISEDKAGSLWFGTDRGGVSQYDRKSFKNFTTDQGLPNYSVRSSLVDKGGDIWFGTCGGGVSQYDGKTFRNFTTAQGLSNNTVYSICQDKMGNFWFGTGGGGVCRYSRKSIPKGRSNFTSFTTDQGLVNNIVLCTKEDRNGNLWFGTDGGLSRYDGKSFCNFTTSHGLVNNSILSILEDKSGNLWFGTADGVNVIPEVSLKKLEFALASTKNQDKYSTTVDFNGPIFITFTTKDGLPDNFVTQIIQMPNGKMAIGTNLGISTFDPSDNFRFLRNIEIFNSNTGYPAKDINAGQNCMYLDSEGVIWAGTGSEKTALVRFDYAALNKNAEAPALVIQSVKVKDEKISWYDLIEKSKSNGENDRGYISKPKNIVEEIGLFGRELTDSEKDKLMRRFGKIQFDSITPFYPIPQKLILPYVQNQISFEYTAIEINRPFLLTYQYMLEGYDTDWRPVTKNSSANFDNLSEGNYTFKLKAQVANGVWSEPILYSFTVLPPWHRTWWAYLIYVSLFLILLRIFSKWRERNLRAEKQKLERVVEERTTELVAEKKESDKQRERSDALLLNILPQEVAEELKEKGSSEAKLFEETTVLFTDFVNFTGAAASLSPHVLVAELHECFTAFDLIVKKYGLEKIKTIGDAYLAISGLPNPDPFHAEKVVMAALDIIDFMDTRKRKENTFDIRIGVSTGSVVAGIVGMTKFQYDIWGDTVNIASRMESSGAIGRVNISAATYELIKDRFICVPRGKIQVKGKGEMEMYFVAEHI